MKITTINSIIFLLLYLKKCFAISYCSVPIPYMIFNLLLFVLICNQQPSLSMSFLSSSSLTHSNHDYILRPFIITFFLVLFSSLSIFFTSCVFSHKHFSLSSSPLLFLVSRENTENVGFSVRQSKYSMFRKFRRLSRYYTLILSRKTQRSHNTPNKRE